MQTLEAVQSKHLLPELPYLHESLEPHIDARTMMLHHDKHHASYVKNLNAALEKYPELHERSAVWLLLNQTSIPQAVRTTVCNNAGGHLNHSMLWRAMSPGGGGELTGALADAVERDFGGLDNLKARFDEAGEKVFGSGWVWLTRSGHNGGKLEVLTTSGHGNPLTQGHFPLLVNDVWEHAYYLKHENRRADYLKGWWPVVNWREVARRFEASGLSPEKRWESDGGLTLPAPK
ncbi:MAG: superoxide dismutase [Betaproteobacteria bacterium]